VTTPLAAGSVPPWPREQSSSAGSEHFPNTLPHDPNDPPQNKPSQSDALQALLAFAALHDQVRRRKALAARRNSFDAESLRALVAEFDPQEQFILDEVLQLVAERAVAITGADGLAIALAENNEIVLRAAAGDVRPDVGARIDRDSAFSGACFRSAQIVMCDDTETDPRVNLQACRKLGARSMVAVPLCGRRRVIGLLEAFSTWPFAFNDSDVRNLSLLAELVLGALKPEDEDRFAESAQAAARRTSLSGAETEPLDHFARPLPIERGRIHHHDAAVARPPRDWNDHPVPERKDAALARRVGPLGMLPAQDFVAQRRPQRANYAVHRGGDYRNLYAARPFELGQPRVVVNVHRFRGIRFLSAWRALVR